MKTRMLNLINLAIEDNTKLEKVENIYDLYDQLQYSENLNEMVSSLVVWLEKNYNVENISFSLFDLKNDVTTSILKKGDEFYLDGEFSLFLLMLIIKKIIFLLIMIKNL
jgi:two-component system cell cycle response regulator